MKKKTTFKTPAMDKLTRNCIPTYTIEGVVITGEEVQNAMMNNIFVGERIIAFTKDGSFFKEEIARSLYLYDRKPELVGGYGLGELGNNTVFELFDHKLTVEEKIEHIKVFTSK